MFNKILTKEIDKTFNGMIIIRLMLGVLACSCNPATWSFDIVFAHINAQLYL
jgi:hypothetical protein